MNRLLLVVILLVSSSVFAAPITYVCTYHHFSDDEGKHRVSSEFVLRFIVDGENGKAYMLGNQGSEEVTVIQNTSGGLSFLEVTGTGNLMTTAIDTKGESVHSRNTLMGGELIPSQYYGECETKY